MDKITELVMAFAQAVVAFSEALTQQEAARKLSTALKSLGNALGTDLLEIGGETIDSVGIKESADFFDGMVQAANVDKVKMQKDADFIGTALEHGIVPEDAVDTAKNALSAWQSVNTSPKAR